MPPSTAKLWERIRAAGIASNEECRQWALSIAQSSSAEYLQDATKLAAELIRLGKITAFQANVLFRDLAIPLSIESYRITQSLELELGKNWFQAVDANGSKTRKYWLYLLTAESMQEPAIKAWPPSTKLALRHAQVAHPSIDKWLYAGIVGANLAAVCESVDGISLSSRLVDGPLSWQASVSMIEQIAAGLQRIHEAGLIHGSIGAESIWCVDDNEFVLRRDPLFLASNPYLLAGHSSLGGSSENRFFGAAPELTLPGIPLSIRTDLYALGCLWHRSLHVSPMFDSAMGGPPEAWGAAHCNEKIDVSDIALPESLRPCLFHLISKNPGARFASAGDLLKAIEHALSAKSVSSPVDTKVVLPSVTRAVGSVASKSKEPTANVPAHSKSVPNQVPLPSNKLLEPPSTSPMELAPAAKIEAASKPAPTDRKTTDVETAKGREPAIPAVSKSAKQQPPALPGASAIPKSPAPKPSVQNPVTAADLVSQREGSKQDSESSPSHTPEPAPTIDQKLVAAVESSLPTDKQVTAPVLDSGEKDSEFAPSNGVDDSRSASVTSDTTLSPEISLLATPLSPTPVKNVSAPAGNKKKKKGSGSKKKKGKKKKPVWLLPVLIGGGFLFFGLFITLLVQFNGGLGPPKKNTTIVKEIRVPQNPLPENEGKERTGQVTSVDTIAEHFSLVNDDGKILWAPPQAGSPYSMEMLPAGLEAAVFVSGNVWQQRGALGTVGKWWLPLQSEINHLLNTYPMLHDDRVRAVAIALYPGKKSGAIQAVFRLSFDQPTAIESVTSSVKGYSTQLLDPKSGRKKGFWSNEAANDPIAFAFDELQTDESATTKRMCVGPQELIASLSETGGAAAPVRRQFELLLHASDSRADLSLLFAPSFLFGPGKDLLTPIGNAQESLRSAIDETMQAVLLTTTVEPRWYIELRMISSETREAGKIGLALKQKLETLPDTIESTLNSSPAHPYWRSLATRYPQMLRSLNKYGRFGLEEGQVVANAYLPNEAVNNVAISSWMALQNASGPVVAQTQVKVKPTVPTATKTIDDILAAKISINFEQESLESALQSIATEVSESVLSGQPISMAINGTAFQIEGITRNQQIRAFKFESVPLREILMDLVRRANPVTTVKVPTEKDQKVVWVVLDAPDDPSKKKIELTTRKWTIENKVTLPAEFVEQQ